jgi:hypothetical protein
MKVTAEISKPCEDYTCTSITINADGVVINTSFYVEDCKELDEMIYAIENKGRAKLEALVQNGDVFEIWPDNGSEQLENLIDHANGKEPSNRIPTYYNGDIGIKLGEGHPFTVEFFKNIKAYIASNKCGIVYSN